MARADKKLVAALVGFVVLIVVLLLSGCGDVDQFGQADAVVHRGSRVACTYDPSPLGICSCGEDVCGACACPRTVAEGGCKVGDRGLLVAVECGGSR